MMKKVAAVAGSLLVCLLVMEISLRAYDVVNGRPFFSGAKVVPYRIFGSDLYQDEGTKLRILSKNGESFPFEKNKDTIRIVTFGGSTSVNAAVLAEFGVNYPSLLQDGLQARFDDRHVEVINVANEAYATTHSITLLAFDVLSWDPDIVILSHNVNDLHASFFPNFRPDYANKYADSYYNLTWFRHTCVNLRLCRFVRSRIEKSKLITYPPQRKSYGPAPSAFVQEVFKRNLRSFAVLAKSKGADVIFGSQPLKVMTEEEFDRDIDVKSYNDYIFYPIHEEFIRYHDQFNEIIENEAQAIGAGYVANDEIFGGEKAYFLDLVHYTREGVDLLARNYEDAVASIISARAPTAGASALTHSQDSIFR